MEIDYVINTYTITSNLISISTAAVAQWVRAKVPQAVGWAFESQSRQFLVVKTGSDRSTANRSAISLSVRVLGVDHKRMPVSQYLWHAKEPSLSAEHSLKCVALHR